MKKEYQSGSKKQRLQELYIQEQELPEELRDKFDIISCISWQEDRSVYLIEDRSGRRSVIKRAEGKQKEMLKREAEVLKSMQFSFLPVFLSWTEEKNTGWLRREYIAGDTLWELVERRGPYGVSEAGSLICRLCEMMGQMHGCRPPLIHRDIKPQNIVLTPEENLFIIDVGTVREYCEGAACDTEFMGTRQTAAPEQYGYRQTDGRTDIYALGVLYLYLLTGSMELQNAKIYEGIPETCRAVIETCTRMDPQERYADMMQLKKAVLKTTARKTTAIGMMRMTARQPADALEENRKKGRTRLHRKIFAFAAALLLVTAGGICAQNLPYRFHSEMIEAAVRMQLGKTQGETIRKKELQRIESLRICGSHILTKDDRHWQFDTIHQVNDGVVSQDRGTVSDLSDLRHMKKLQTLVLDQQEISDITPLKDLPLVSVSLCDNPVKDFSPLADSAILEELYIEETEVQSLEAFSELTALRVLAVSNAEPADLAPLQDSHLEELRIVMIEEESEEILKKLPLRKLMIHSWSAELEEKIGQMKDLEELTVYGYQNSSLAPLLGLSGLRKLNLYNGNLQSIEGLEKFSYLYDLCISRTKVKDISQLRKLERLTSISLDNTQITDFTVLKELKALQRLQCDEAQRPEIEKLSDSLWFTLEIC